MRTQYILDYLQYIYGTCWNNKIARTRVIKEQSEEERCRKCITYTQHLHLSDKMLTCCLTARQEINLNYIGSIIVGILGSGLMLGHICHIKIRILFWMIRVLNSSSVFRIKLSSLRAVDCVFCLLFL